MVSSQIYKQHPKSEQHKNKNFNIYNFNNGEIFIVNNKRPGVQNILFKSKNDIIYFNDMNNTKGLSMLSTMEENRKHYT